MGTADGQRRHAGFTLLETNLALALSLIVTGALFHFLIDYQRVGLQLMNALEQEQRLALTPLALNAVLAGAGNHRPRSSIVVKNAPAALEVEADLTGPDGFPDGQLSSPYEQVALLSRDGALRLRSGGSGYQPLVADLVLNRVELPEPVLVTLQLSNGPPPRVLSDPPGGESLEFDLYLWNRRTCLLGDEP